jgi:hypothetical protein
MNPGNIILYCSKPFLVLLFLGGSFTARAQTFEDSTATIEEVADTSLTDEEEDEEIVQNKNKFLEREEGDSFYISERHLPPDHAKKLKEDKDFWYVDSEIKKKEKKKQGARESSYVPLGQRDWFQTLLWLVIIGAFAGAIMWYLADSNIGIFRKKDTAAVGDHLTDEIPEDIFAINYQREIDKAASQGNYRLAVRLMYLRLLKDLADRNIIQYKQDKTNFDYLLQLHPTKYYNHFFRLTRHYEYSWYGHFDVEENKYSIIKNDFNQFERDIH